MVSVGWDKGSRMEGYGSDWERQIGHQDMDLLRLAFGFRFGFSLGLRFLCRVFWFRLFLGSSARSGFGFLALDLDTGRTWTLDSDLGLGQDIGPYCTSSLLTWGPEDSTTPPTTTYSTTTYSTTTHPTTTHPTTTHPTMIHPTTIQNQDNMF